MSRLSTTTLALALASSSLVGCVAADGAGDEGISLVKAVAVTGDECSFSSSEGELYLPHGLISVYSPNAYRMIPQLKSRVTAETDQIDQRTIQLRGARVDLDFVNSELEGLIPENQRRFKSLFSAPLAPNGGISDGIIDLIPEGAIAVARDYAGNARFETEVIAKVVVYGDLAGEEVTSQEFQFPVTLCNDCVIGNVDATGALPTCPMATSPRAGNACNPFQDGVVDCCATEDGIVCPGVVAQN